MAEGAGTDSFFAADCIGGGALRSSSMSGQSKTEVADLLPPFLEFEAEASGGAAAAVGADVAAPLAPLAPPRAPRPLPLDVVVGGDVVVGASVLSWSESEAAAAAFAPLPLPRPPLPL